MGSKKGKNSKKARKAAKKRRARIILFSIEIVALIGLVFVLWFVLKGTEAEKINIEDKISSNDLGDYWDEVNNTSNPDGGTSKGFMQVALFGVDSRNGELSKNTRTDTIMIAVINLDTMEVKICSVYRDTYLNLSNDSYDKCNAAYAYGGPEQAINMLNMNLDLNITDYVTVGFKGVVETVDALGGIQVDVQSDEIGYLNDYQYCICEDLNRMSEYNPVANTGLQTLNGLQTLGYCRIRYTSGDDFRRTERQRNVLVQMSEQAKLMSVAQLNDVATGAFSNVSTSFDLDTILSLVADAPNYTVVGSEGFPFADYRATGTLGPKGSCVIPTDLVTNVSLLHNYLFGTENYQPSETVVNCSNKIDADVSQYL